MELIGIILVCSLIFFLLFEGSDYKQTMKILKWTPEEVKKYFTDNYDLDFMFIIYGQEYAINWKLLKSICCVESMLGKNQGIIGNIFQLKEPSVQEVERVYKMTVDRGKLKTLVAYSTKIACMYIKVLYGYTGIYTLNDVLVCYNYGYGNYKKYNLIFSNIPQEYKDYVLAVLKLYNS